MSIDMGFSGRLRKAFNNADNKEIARRMGVTPSAVSNYFNGRVPDPVKLLEIQKLTNCNLHWLLTGEGSPDTAFYSDYDRQQIEEIRQRKSEQDLRSVTQEEILNVILQRGLRSFRDDDIHDEIRDFLSDPDEIYVHNPEHTLTEAARILVRNEISSGLAANYIRNEIETRVGIEMAELQAKVEQMAEAIVQRPTAEDVEQTIKGILRDVLTKEERPEISDFYPVPENLKRAMKKQPLVINVDEEERSEDEKKKTG